MCPSVCLPHSYTISQSTLQFQSNNRVLAAIFSDDDRNKMFLLCYFIYYRHAPSSRSLCTTRYPGIVGASIVVEPDPLCQPQLVLVYYREPNGRAIGRRRVQRLRRDAMWCDSCITMKRFDKMRQNTIRPASTTQLAQVLSVTTPFRKKSRRRREMVQHQHIFPEIRRLVLPQWLHICAIFGNHVADDCWATN